MICSTCNCREQYSFYALLKMIGSKNNICYNKGCDCSPSAPECFFKPGINKTVKNDLLIKKQKAMTRNDKAVFRLADKFIRTGIYYKLNLFPGEISHHSLSGYARCINCNSARIYPKCSECFPSFPPVCTNILSG